MRGQPRRRMDVAFPWRKGVWGLLGLGASIAVTMTAVYFLAPRPLSDPRSGTVRTVSDPRLADGIPFRNIHPSVRYVGDQACGRCHEKHLQTFREHPMGRSLAPLAASSAAERYDAAAHNPFTNDGVRYSVEQVGNRMIHHEARLDATGAVVSQQQADVQFAVGSASHGRSYLIERDGVLVMSPITWYPEKNRWDLSPGYRQLNQHFGRPITAECLFCHCNHADRIEDTFNRYRAPIFRGYTIGCERCHGPGELHVQRRERETSVEGEDNTIVNPGRLDLLLRDAVCEQCHLQGASRVIRKGRDTFDFRPGLPLHDFLSVFVKPPELTEDRKFVGQVEQMKASKCYQATAGKLGCISCHDPHRKPTPAERLQFYRQRCLNCHESQGCSVPLVARQKTSPEDSCIACHMPRNEADITHTSISDHRVPRRPSGPAARPRPGRSASQFPLVYFYKDSRPAEDPGVQRDLCIALMDVASRSSESVQKTMSQLALQGIDDALARDPADFELREAQAVALSNLDRWQEAARVLDELLAERPEREACLDLAATVALLSARHLKAVEYWQRALQINPHRWRYHAGLASAHAALREWTQARHHAERTLELHHLHHDTRIVLIVACEERGDRPRARRELDTLLRMNPPNADELRRRFAPLLSE